MDTLTAYHEAGHATISLLLGESPDYATIEATDDMAGHMAYLPVESRAIAWSSVYGKSLEDQDRVLDWLVATASGPASQALYMRRGSRVHFLDKDSWETFGGGIDFRKATNVTGDLPYANLEDAAEQAFDLLEQPSIWASVEHVAKDLLQFRTLDFEGIRDAALNYEWMEAR
jgi:hypothetical protein